MGALCIFYLKICCFYVNQSDIVRNAAQKLKDRTYRICQQLSKSWGSWSKIWSWASWLLPLAGSLLVIILTLVFRPYILNLLTKCISSCPQAINFQMTFQQDSEPVSGVETNPEISLSHLDKWGRNFIVHQHSHRYESLLLSGGNMGQASSPLLDNF